ncbi:MAG: hypothetical protein IKY83_07590 [Proteobacteria bacterium]|nr:hypothetical protein [Pseudomonadota bacterium]
MKRPRLIRTLCAGLCALCAVAAGCATTTAPIRDVPRERGYQFAPEQVSGAPHVAFVAKGAYIVGLANDQSFASGTWLRLTPGASWPDAESRPTLVTARIAERTPSTARLEMASFQPGIRTTRLNIEPYSGSESVSGALHAMTKRLVFAAGPVQDGPVATTLTGQDLIEGGEIYGAFSLDDTGSARRLANQMTALFTVTAKPEKPGDTVRLSSAAGVCPDSPVFILLDAPAEPAFDVVIRFPNHPEAELQAIENAIHAMHAQMQLPGISHVRLEHLKTSPTVTEAIAEMSGTQTETLTIAVREDDRQIAVLDQGLRLRDDLFPVTLDTESPETAAAQLTAQALAMLGHHASAAFLLEQTWRGSTSAATRAALAPMLAQAYHDLERDDWALEIALELISYLAQTKDNAVIRAAAAAILAMTGRAQEFSQVFNKAASEAGKLPSDSQKLMIRALLMAQDMPGADAHIQAIKHTLTRAGKWHAFDEMALCAGRIETDDDACSEGQDHATEPFEKLWFEAISATRTESTQRLLELALAADDIGAPNLAAKLWTAIIQNGLAPEAALSAYKTLADYEKTAGELRAYAHLMAELAMSQASAGHPVDAQTYSETLSVWRALDYREVLAGVCTAKAASASPNERIDLLTFAGMLYRSVGDAENSAITDSMLYRAHTDTGNTREAELCRDRALRYAGKAEHPEVMQAIQDNLDPAKQAGHEAQ